MRALWLAPLLCCAVGHAADSAASVAADFHSLSVDPSQTYRILDLSIARGDIKIYLTAGTLAFTKPIAGHVVAAIFTSANTEAGDAELLVLPPSRSERASLARYAKTPNLDEHFSSAVFLFTDDTAQELKAQLQDRPLHPAPEEGKALSELSDRTIRADLREIDVKIAQALLDLHPAERGFFYGIVGGRTLGVFDVIYDPSRTEPVVVGHVATAPQGYQYFQIWTSFHPRHKAPPFDLSRSISNYQLDTEIHPDLTMSASAKFSYHASPFDGRVIPLELSSRLRITSARVDGHRAEFYQHELAPGVQFMPGGAPVTIVAREPLSPETAHQVEIYYEGSVVFRTAAGNYFVDERNTWYPYVMPMLTTFDLTFHCPKNLHVVATGDLVSDEVSGDVRTVHRRTALPEPLAGFNLGDYSSRTLDHAPYRIELFANRLEDSADLPRQAASILDYFSSRWQPLGLQTLAISPVEGYFGQGFPGMIYLSNIAYIQTEDRPAPLRNPRLDSFFSGMLLPHEIAHQWWGNMASPADYRIEWLFEAMSSYSAMQYLEANQGRAVLDDILESYRQDLLSNIESAGPLDFGERILDNDGMRPWHVVVYEKGAWVLHMLRRRLGDDAFHTLQTRLLSEYRNKLVTNEDFKRIAASLVPSDQPDKSLNSFFENWVSSTGIPVMELKQTRTALSLKLSGVDEAFAADVPLACDNAATFWVHAGAGDNSFELPANVKSCQLPKQTDFLYRTVN